MLFVKKNTLKVLFKTFYIYLKNLDTKPPIKYILDVTIAYPNGHPLSLATLTFGTREKCDIAVNYKVYETSKVSLFGIKSINFLKI